MGRRKGGRNSGPADLGVIHRAIQEERLRADQAQKAAGELAASLTLCQVVLACILERHLDGHARIPACEVAEMFSRSGAKDAAVLGLHKSDAGDVTVAYPSEKLKELLEPLQPEEGGPA